MTSLRRESGYSLDPMLSAGMLLGAEAVVVFVNGRIRRQGMMKSRPEQMSLGGTGSGSL